MVEAFPSPSYHVHVGHGRFYHDDVGALGDVACDLTHRFPGVGRVHLVAAAVTELGSRTGGYPEGSVEGRSVLGGVTHDRHIFVTVVVQGVADGFHLPVHHGRWRNHVGAGLYLCYGRSGQQFQRGVVVHLTVVDDAAVAVVGVLAHAHVGDNHHAGYFFLDGPDRFLDYSFRVVSFGAHRVLLRRQSKEQHGGNPQGGRLGNVKYQLIYREVKAAGHGFYGLAQSLTVGNEHRVDKVGRRQGGFTDHSPERFVLADAA